MSAPATNVVDQLTNVRLEEVQPRLRLCHTLRGSGSGSGGGGQVLLSQAHLDGPSARRNRLTLDRDEGEPAGPRPVHHVGNDVVAARARHLFAHHQATAYRAAGRRRAWRLARVRTEL